MRLSKLSIIAGPCAAIIVYIVLPSHYSLAGAGDIVLQSDARWTLALASWMALWWLTEALPVAATALLPIAVFPLFGLNSTAAVTAAYAHPLIFLFFGGFLLSIAIEKWGLHRWLAQRVVGRAGDDPRRLVAGFMLVSAFASMWLSNTATTIMMLPIAVSIIADVDRRAPPQVAANFARCLLLGVAYAASIGGTATLIGSPPNLFVASFLHERFGVDLDFRQWLLVAMPVSLVMLPLTWLVLTRVVAPLGRTGAGIEFGPIGAAPWSALAPGARRVAVLFLLTVAAWLTRASLNSLEIDGVLPFAGLTDTGIAVLAGLALFVIPAGGTGPAGVRLMTWQDAERLPFGTLILFGGGLALAGTVSATAADQFIGAQLAALQGIPTWLAVMAVVSAVVFLTELTSNTATTTTLVPILAAAAVALHFDPFGLVIVTALAASCAFMMPVATPPNAIIFSSDRVPVAAMARAGLLINVIAIVVITVVALYWIPRVTPVGLAP